MTLSLRLGIELYRQLKEIALKEERSINGQICYIIKKYIEEQKEKED